MYRYIRVVLILFGISFTALFIQHHVELSEFRSEQKSKDVYYPTNSRDRGLQTTRQEFQEYFINVRLSDDIPVNRDIPDSRPDSCETPVPSQLTVSVIITFYREWPSILLRTIYSVAYMTQNLQQIILVDDDNDETVYGQVLNLIRKTFRDVVKVVSLRRRFGLIGARLEGVKHATGNVICFLDSHMEVNINWSIPLLNIIDENPNAVAMSQLDDINPSTFKYTFSKTYRTRYGFDWRLRFFETEFRKEQLEHGDLVLPGVLAVGSAFAIRKEFFREIGMYDAGLKIWGGENLELSFKVWLCGGKLVHVACSRIGHITRSQPYLQNNRLDIEMHNNKRVADVWMDKFASYVYDNYPGMKSISVGGLSKQWRQRRRCKPFSWFLDNIWPELFRYKDHSSSTGSIMNTNGGRLCLDNQGHLFSSPLRITVKPCSNDTNTQLFGLTTDGRLRTNLQCMFVKKEIFDLVPYIQNCYEQPQHTFKFTKNGEIIHTSTGYCLTIHGYNIGFEMCRKDNHQKWSLLVIQI
ncbi:inactive polypeptide N-acetylgalactosaminyltransferase-like protein 5 isoform X1 [Mytilus galloprovincialis]|uniref:inactive polypeptide N-acetylgalactosaminyltransferase-like protein 5 isoform X1 n=1 Tax=Mytilus galloprovincialis TaxID=29158 RepID=UPI003F7BE717